MKYAAEELASWFKGHIDRAIAVRDFAADRMRRAHQRKVKVAAAAIESGRDRSLYSCIVTDGVRRAGPFLVRVDNDCVEHRDARFLAVLAGHDVTAFEILRAAQFLEIPVEINGDRVEGGRGARAAVLGMAGAGAQVLS
jgi:hypothetical protein